ncbi:MAG: tyrosine-type recombinase/integrase [Burkholderiales bacterium]|nr:tyrosine-type recombinase/integrase [Burkholderiales bacterium]
MKNKIFKSIFAKELKEYLELKVKASFKEESYRGALFLFDEFCVSRGINVPTFTKEDWSAWTIRRPNEDSSTFYHRVNVVKNFLLHLSRDKNYSICPVKDVKFVAEPFDPHIYTTEEICHYFKAVDSYRGSNLKDALQFPVLFRIMYCCGTRLMETLRIRKGDIDFENAVITLRETKLGKERLIPYGDDLKALLKSFAEKCLHGCGDRSYIFTGKNGGPLSARVVQEAHGKFLSQAGIPFEGNHRGPRIHDWRHHMAVFSAKRLSDSGMDLYVALPILATYLGHTSVKETEKYLRLTAQLFLEVEEKFGKILGEITKGDKNEDD